MSTNHIQPHGTFKTGKKRKGLCSRNLPNLEIYQLKLWCPDDFFCKIKKKASLAISTSKGFIKTGCKTMLRRTSYPYILQICKIQNTVAVTPPEMIT